MTEQLLITGLKKKRRSHSAVAAPVVTSESVSTVLSGEEIVNPALTDGESVVRYGDQYQVTGVSSQPDCTEQRERAFKQLLM